jgi:hypothetical protein
MNEVDLRTEYLGFIEDETNNKFDPDNLPSGVKLALDMLVKLDPMDFDIASESIGDMSQSFVTNDEGIPIKVLRWLKPYYRLKSL